MDTEAAAVHYSRGRNAYDAFPEQRTASRFEEFARAVLADRSAAKGLAWISAPFAQNGDGRHHRCRDGALPRRFLAFDLDGGTREAAAELGLYFSAYSGFWYTTASNTAETPRMRYVLQLSRPVDRAEGIRLGAAMQRQILALLGELPLDPSVYRSEQPVFGPLHNADVGFFSGDAVDVDSILKDSPPQEERPGPADRAAATASRDPVVRVLTDCGMIKRGHSDGKLAIVCPFEAEHTEPGGESSTVYFLPNFGGVRYGRFKCLHRHCEGRQQEDHLTALGLDPKEVWRHQAGGPAPYDDLPPVDSYDEVSTYPEIPPLDALRIDPAELVAARLTPRCVVESYLYSDVAVLVGPGGTGKTTAFLFEAAHIVLGRPVYGLQVHTPGSVVLVTAEDRRELLIARLGRIMDALGLDDEERAKVCAGILIWDVTGTVCRLTELDKQGNVVLTGLADAIVERFREAPPVLVGLDPLVSFGVGERLVNDHEHSLILAARRIVRGLVCCVRLIAHTGKEAARSGTLDQYASRGGSALADGARMVAVLRSWDPEAVDDKLTPPPGLSVGADEQVIVLARPKLSYSAPQPLVWIVRRVFEFQHFTATRPDPEAEAKARADQLERYLIEEVRAGKRYTQNMLQDVGVMKRKDLRMALATLLASGRVIYAAFPGDKRARGAREYLHPVGAGAPGPTAQRSENTPEDQASPCQADQALAGAPAYREKKDGAPRSADSFPSFPRCAGTPRHTDGAPGAASETGGAEEEQGRDAQDHEDRQDRQCLGDGGDHSTAHGGDRAEGGHSRHTEVEFEPPRGPGAGPSRRGGDRAQTRRGHAARSRRTGRG